MTEADDLDRASDLTLIQTGDALDAVRYLARPEQEQLPDGSWPQTECGECGEEIPEARLKLGKVRCIDCQTVRERRRAGL